jgi:RHS repeat-associated protein
VARYSQGLNIDEPLAMLRSSTTSYYEADGLGSATSLSNMAGAAAQTYSYDSFGNIIAASGSLTNSFRYTGREYDTETGLYYYRARYYDPSVGRFISEDPLEFAGESTSFYEYDYDDPANFIDPSGMQSQDTCVKHPEVCGPAMPALYDPPWWSMPAAPPAPAPPAPPPGWNLPGGPRGSTKGDSTNPSAQLSPAQLAKKRQQEFDAYKRRCSEQVPSGLNPCDSARWKLNRNTDCRNMRQAWDDKWSPGRHANDLKELDISIQKLKEWITKNCSSGGRGCS